MTTQRSRSGEPSAGGPGPGRAAQARPASRPASIPPAGRRDDVPLALVGNLVGRIAHDLNNVLTPIVGNTELALYSLAEDHPARPDIEQAHEVALEKGRLLSQRLVALARAIEDPGGGDPTEALAAFGIEASMEPRAAKPRAAEQPPASQRVRAR